MHPPSLTSGSGSSFDKGSIRKAGLAYLALETTDTPRFSQSSAKLGPRKLRLTRRATTTQRPFCFLVKLVLPAPIRTTSTAIADPFNLTGRFGEQARCCGIGKFSVTPRDCQARPVSLASDCTVIPAQNSPRFDKTVPARQNAAPAPAASHRARLAAEHFLKFETHPSCRFWKVALLTSRNSGRPAVRCVSVSGTSGNKL
ncbi:hypothetical protein Q5752_006566 [Cryptotrichosporon argae]